MAHSIEFSIDLESMKELYFNAAVKRNPTNYLPQFGNDKIRVTTRYVETNGKPCVPVMGEMHISRVPVERWKETLLKMKAGGVDVVASYIFWIHHEEEKGVFDFSGNRDLRSFIKMCRDIDLGFCLRIGPYVNAECRNGGLPDWLVEECKDTCRTEKEPYWGYAMRYIHQIAEQIRDLEFWGIQIENEMVNNAQYLEHLRQAVVSEGFRAPLFTATAWGNASLPETLLPMYGGYPDAPWVSYVHPLDPNPNLFFSRQREDGLIGNDLIGKYGISEDKYKDKFPFMTCESGGGNQITYRRRPLFVSEDIEDITIVKLGNGANLIGYYMYAGGLQPIGKHSTLQCGGCPVISYDFEAPIGDMGQLRRSWFRLSRIHAFLHNCGEILAPMDTVLPDVMPANLDDMTTLRCALRTDGKSGFLFVSNRMRTDILPAHPGQQFDIDFEDRHLSFCLDIPGECTFFIPVGFTIRGISFSYVSAMPISMNENGVTFARIRGMEPAAVLSDGIRYSLKEGKTNINGLFIELLPEETDYRPSDLVPLNVCETEVNTCDPGILLDHLSLNDLTKEYSVCWTKDISYLVICATGDVAGFYVDGKLLSDCFINGDKWVIDVRNIKSDNGIIKIQPFTPDKKDKVYLEVPFITGHHVPKVFAVTSDTLVI